MSRRLALVFAHPDDDTFAAAGTVAIHAGEPGFSLTCVLATSGEKGGISDPSVATPESLGRVRETEDMASWRALGREPDRLEFLRYPDGGVSDVLSGELVGRIASILREVRPDVVVTFGPEGITGHEDHIAVGRAATEAFSRTRTEGGGGLGRLLHCCLPESRLDWFSEELVKRGMDPIDPSAPFQPRSVPDDAVAIRVDCSAVWRRKLAALREHKTQADEMAFPEDLVEPILGSEHFVQAWPERRHGDPVLGDIFEGLPELRAGPEPPPAG